MGEAQVAPYQMSNDYLNHLNRLLTRHGFGPQEQGVIVDWDGLDAALEAHYRVKLKADTPAKPAKPAQTRKRHTRKKKTT
jgi:hypothetical protein